MLPVVVSVLGQELGLRELSLPLALEALVTGTGEWEIEIGFGKGRYLLRRARQDPERRFLGIEMAARYYALARKRMRKQGLTNLALVRGEALFVLAALLPPAIASAVHVYFPDPWPKSRHHKRRLFDPETVDLVLGLLRPGGRLYFATDHVEYGHAVQEILESHPAIEVRVHSGPWPEGPRTNYESKYESESRPILRLEVVRAADAVSMLHPAGSAGVLVAADAAAGLAESRE
jgi:tRNA (guanine-N7-)-methyltransferase